MFNPVSQPAHYTDRVIEVIDIIEDNTGRAPDPKLGFLQGQVLKYVCRAWDKDDAVQDLQKAEWYLSRMISTLISDELDAEDQAEARRQQVKDLQAEFGLDDDYFLPFEPVERGDDFFSHARGIGWGLGLKRVSYIGFDSRNLGEDLYEELLVNQKYEDAEPEELPDTAPCDFEQYFDHDR